MPGRTSLSPAVKPPKKARTSSIDVGAAAASRKAKRTSTTRSKRAIKVPYHGEDPTRFLDSTAASDLAPLAPIVKATAKLENYWAGWDQPVTEPAAVGIRSQTGRNFRRFLELLDDDARREFNQHSRVNIPEAVMREAATSINPNYRAPAPKPSVDELSQNVLRKVMNEPTRAESERKAIGEEADATVAKVLSPVADVAKKAWRMAVPEHQTLRDNVVTRIAGAPTKIAFKTLSKVDDAIQSTKAGAIASRFLWKSATKNRLRDRFWKSLSDHPLATTAAATVGSMALSLLAASSNREAYEERERARAAVSAGPDGGAGRLLTERIDRLDADLTDIQAGRIGPKNGFYSSSAYATTMGGVADAIRKRLNNQIVAAGRGATNQVALAQQAAQDYYTQYKKVAAVLPAEFLGAMNDELAVSGSSVDPVAFSRALGLADWRPSDE